ncbi:hypothetical protein F9C11_16995 [Amycolatopsis sp. VS8301801F10]|uniref:hypothetical protein n=1 Tax=Amycolatopsis sp. VS8301801F10 TaxID=2652442 RepID=UPI0038FCBC11
MRRHDDHPWLIANDQQETETSGNAWSVAEARDLYRLLDQAGAIFVVAANYEPGHAAGPSVAAAGAADPGQAALPWAVTDPDHHGQHRDDRAAHRFPRCWNGDRQAERRTMARPVAYCGVLCRDPKGTPD